MNKLYLKKIFEWYEKGEISKQIVHKLIQLNSLASTHHCDQYAVIGLSCYMPEANSVFEFWDNLIHEKNSIRDFPLSRRIDIDPLLAAIPKDHFIPGKTYWRGGFLDEVAFFDNELFNILPAEAKIMDPQIRLFMQAAYHAFENAGYTKDRLTHHQTGIFIGDVNNEYRDIINKINASSVVGNISPFIGARVARFYNTQGPVVNVSSTCSSSLTALHFALLSLSAHECDMALVGAANLRLFPFHLKDDPVGALGILSPDEECRTFDDRANGIVRGEGILAILIKRMQDAVRDKDYIYAKILASTVNNDGCSSSVGAPNPRAQEQLLLNAWKKAGIDPGNISYIEAHGTGTRMGDPIEIQAMQAAFREYTDAKQFCGIGSIKTNIGHLTGGGAGLAGLFKVVCGLEKRKIPASLNFTIPNSLIDFSSSPLFVVNETLKLTSNTAIFAGVSAFGFNGTNCHVVLESHEMNVINDVPLHYYPFVFSARNGDLLKQLLESHLDAIQKDYYDDYRLSCISYTLLLGRETFSHKICLFADSLITLAHIIKRILTEWNRYDFTQIEQAIIAGENHSRDRLLLFSSEAKIWLKAGEIPERWLQLDEIHTVPLVPSPFQGKHFWQDVSLLKKDILRVAKTNHEVYPDDFSIHLRELWSEVLGLEKIDENTSFFNLGGDSLLAVQLLNTIKSRFQKDILYEEFANNSTIAELTQILKGTEASAFRPIQPILAQIAPLSRAQWRMWFMRHHQPHGNAYNMPQLLTVKTELNLSLLQDAVRAIIKKFEILRTIYQIQNGEPMQMVIPDQNDFIVHLFDYTKYEDADHEVIRQCQKLSQQCFNLEKLYLFSCTVFKKSHDDYRICFIIDHMICDGWSLHLLLQEVFEQYMAINNHERLIIEDLIIQFKDFAFWENHYLQSQHAKKSEMFWQEKLLNYQKNAEIPGDLIRPVSFDYQGQDFIYLFDDELSDLIKYYLRGKSITLYELLVSSVFVLTYLYSNQTDIILGSVGSGRAMKQLDHQIGCFANLLPIRQYINDQLNFDFLLKEVRLFLQQALECQNYPFDKMVELLNCVRDSSRHPLFSIHVSLQDYKYMERRHKRLQSLQLAHVYLPNHSAKWDLQFEFTDKGACIEARLEYASSIYSSNMAKQIAETHEKVLKELLRRSNAPLSDFRHCLNHNRQTNKLAFAWN